MFGTKNYIYVSNYIHSCLINIENFKIDQYQHSKDPYEYIGYLNENYILKHKCDRLYTSIFSSDMKFLGKIPLNTFNGVTIDNRNNILIISYTKFHIYDIEGNLIKEWELPFKKKKIFLLEKLHLIEMKSFWLILYPIKYLCYLMRGKL
jgi:hypothetical protein